MTLNRSTIATAARSCAALALATVLWALVAATLAPPAADAAVACDRWAAGDGDDGNDGSRERPLATIRRLADALEPGQIGCLRHGTTVDTAGGWGILVSGGKPGAAITIRSEPGGTATVRGQVLVHGTVSDVVLRDLRIVGTPQLSAKSSLVMVNGDRVQLLDNEITHPRGICVDLGDLAAYSHTVEGDRADDVVLDGNRIHDCGMAPELVFEDRDSGAHGVYVVHTRNARVTNNVIHRNRYRGLQTWPYAQGTLVANNVFDANATHVNVGGALAQGYPWYSSDTVVRDNVMTNRVTDWRPEKNPAAIYGNFPVGSATYGNQAAGNCIDGRSAPATGGYGIAFGAQVHADPVYVDRAGDDLRLADGSPCAGKGPNPRTEDTDDQPAVPSVTVSATGPARATAGMTVTHRFAVTNSSTVPADTTVSIGRSGSASVAAQRLTASRGSCVGQRCALGPLAPGQAAVVTVVSALSSPGPHTIGAAVGPLGDTASVSVSVAGQACTVAGGLGHDSLTGTARADVLCGFTGNDVLRPGRGDDVVIAGPGRDRVSYAGAPGAVVVNLAQKSAWDSGNGAVGWDVFRSVEQARGGSYADTLVGSARANVLLGGGGGDHLIGLGGRDRLAGGRGNDRLNGGTAIDTCRQGRGSGPRISCER